MLHFDVNELGEESSDQSNGLHCHSAKKANVALHFNSLGLGNIWKSR